jgi:hypothetical protein
VVQAQVAKQTVFASDPHIQGHVSPEGPPATTSRRLIPVRDRRVSRLSSSFFGSLFFMDGSSLSVELYNGTSASSTNPDHLAGYGK